MVLIVPSCNTDQGVQHTCECSSFQTTAHSESKGWQWVNWNGISESLLIAPLAAVFDKQLEHVCWDPKDGELCLGRMKPEETLVEVQSDSNVQIDRENWV